METPFLNEFDEKFRDEYRQGLGHCEPTNPNHAFDTTDPDTTDPSPVSPRGEADTLPLTVDTTPPFGEVRVGSGSVGAESSLFGHPIIDYLNMLYPNGFTGSSRHKWMVKIVTDVMILSDGNTQQAKAVMLQMKDVQDVVAERGEAELDSIIALGKKRMEKKESESLYDVNPSRQMQQAIEQVTHRKYRELVREGNKQMMGAFSENEPDDSVVMLERLGREFAKFIPHYPLLQLACYRQKVKYYVAIIFLVGAFAMTLMTRCWYRFWPSPGRKCRLNSLLLLIGRMGGGKYQAVQLYKMMMEPIKKTDAAQIAALNQWNREREQNSGGAKNKSPRPNGIQRSLPSETSTAAMREAEANAMEVIDGEEWPLHVSIFDSELQNTLHQMKKSHMDALLTYWLKSFHSEPHGAYLKTSSAPVGEYDVHFNAVYTGTDDALRKLATESNFVNGLLSRFTCVPNADSNFEMMEVHDYDEEAIQHDKQLLEWAYKLDSTKGEIPCKPISEALKNWTARRMEDAKEDNSLAQEDLVKRPCWHAINFALPFIVSRHWGEMVEDGGRWKCGTGFKVDKTDIQLALLFARTQLTFQEYFFKAIGEKHYDNLAVEQASNVCHQQRTLLAFRRLPNPFNSEDVDRCYAYNGKTGSICSRLKRLQDDGLAQKIRTGEHKGMYRKLA